MVINTNFAAISNKQKKIINVIFRLVLCYHCFKFPKTVRPYGVVTVSRFLMAIGRNFSGFYYHHFPEHFWCQLCQYRNISVPCFLCEKCSMRDTNLQCPAQEYPALTIRPFQHIFQTEKNSKYKKSLVYLPNRSENEKFPPFYRIISVDKKVCRKNT